MVQAGRVPDNVIVDMGLVYMGADNKRMVPFGESHSQFIAQAVGILRCDLAGNKGLAYLIGDHIVRSPLSAGPSLILPLGQKKLCVSNPAITLIAGDQSAVVRLSRIFYIVNDIADGLTNSPALAGVQGDETGGSDKSTLLASHYFFSV